jgi:thiamine transport system permease protein
MGFSNGLRIRSLWQGIPALLLIIIMVVPIILAWQRLVDTSELSFWQSLFDLDSRRQTKEAVSFSILIGLISALGTALIGLPLSFMLGRWKWAGQPLLKLLATLPFIVPSIVATLGFLELLRNGGIFHSISGLDLISEKGIISDMGEVLGIQHLGWLIAILMAHIWFNIALFVRLVEPVISRLDEKMLEQAMVLPAGGSRLGRIRILWLPLTWAHAASAMVLTFVFCATSFAIILHFGGFEFYTMERAMAELGGSAGICAKGASRCYGADASAVVMALSSIQLLIILSALSLQSFLARKKQVPWPISQNKKKQASKILWIPMTLMMVFLAAPLISIFVASFKVKGDFSSLAWSTSFEGEMFSHLENSLLYASMTALIIIPFSILCCEICILAEKRASRGINPRLNRLWSAFNENLALTPLALSSVMIGLGVLIGIIRISPSLIQEWWIPLIGHCMVALPFAMKCILQAMRNLRPGHQEIAATLGLTPFENWLKVRLRLLKSPIIVASSLVIAISLGEFGASWVVIRATSHATLPMFIDSAISRPFDYLARPSAMVASTILLACCAILHLAAERFRGSSQGSGF